MLTMQNKQSTNIRLLGLQSPNIRSAWWSSANVLISSHFCSLVIELDLIKLLKFSPGAWLVVCSKFFRSTLFNPTVVASLEHLSLESSELSNWIPLSSRLT